MKRFCISSDISPIIQYTVDITKQQIYLTSIDMHNDERFENLRKPVFADVIVGKNQYGKRLVDGQVGNVKDLLEMNLMGADFIYIKDINGTILRIAANRNNNQSFDTITLNDTRRNYINVEVSCAHLADASLTNGAFFLIGQSVLTGRISEIVAVFPKLANPLPITTETSIVSDFTAQTGLTA